MLVQIGLCKKGEVKKISKEINPQRNLKCESIKEGRRKLGWRVFSLRGSFFGWFKG